MEFLKCYLCEKEFMGSKSYADSETLCASCKALYVEADEDIIPGNEREETLPVLSDLVNPEQVEIIASKLYVRKGPGMTFPHVRILTRGEIVEIVEKRDSWGRLSSSGLDYCEWISLAYVSES